MRMNRDVWKAILDSSRKINIAYTYCQRMMHCIIQKSANDRKQTSLLRPTKRRPLFLRKHAARKLIK